MPHDPLAGMLRARGRRPVASDNAAAKAAKGFESILIYRMLEEMKRTIPDSGLLETAASRQMQGIFWYYLAQEMADQGGLGMWRHLQNELTGSAAPAPAPSEPTP